MNENLIVILALVAYLLLTCLLDPLVGFVFAMHLMPLMGDAGNLKIAAIDLIAGLCFAIPVGLLMSGIIQYGVNY